MISGNKMFWEKLYVLFKYSIYALLILNTYLFFQEDWAASSHTFQNGVPLSDVISAFTATIDTFNWVILLLLFELETWVLSDEALENNLLKWGLMGTRGVCYSIIVYAFYGYISKMMLFYGFVSFPVTDICSMIDGQLAKIDIIDEYSILNAKNCLSLQGMELFKLTGQNLIADADKLIATQRLAWVDVINAGAWIGVVIILEIDVWFQLKGMLKGTLLQVSKNIKFVLYSTLIICAIYWGLLGDLLDFWDAFLWILAFAFIEMNLFQWQQETQEMTEKSDQ